MIRRFYATKDNTITNAFKENLTTRATGSNMGASDILEVFSIYGQESSTSAELARTLIQFNTSEISTHRTNGTIPVSGSVSFYLKMYNAPHSQTVPISFTLQVSAVSSSWQEGYGIDMDYYEDVTRDGIGSNWIQARQSASADGGQWTTIGGDYHASPIINQSFPTGVEDLCLDVTSIVEDWIKGEDAGGKNNYGFGIRLTDSFEAYLSSSTGQNTSTEIHNLSGQQRSFFTKKFFGRDSEFFFQKPVIEARWDSSRRDNRADFFISSSAVPADDNLNTLFLYNNVRGNLTNIPSVGTGSIFVDLYSTVGSTANRLNTNAFTGSHVSTGVYQCEVFSNTVEEEIFDIWYDGSREAPTIYHTGSISTKSFDLNIKKLRYVLSMPNLKDEYRKDQRDRLDLYLREKNWSPNIYTEAIKTSVPTLIVPSASFQIRRSIDDYVVVPYGTGTSTESPHTALSYGVSGNYFELDTTYLEAGYLYDIQYSFYDTDYGWQEQPYRFKFRVVD